MLDFLKNMLQLILAPERGWEDVAAEDTDPDVIIRHRLWPFAAIAAISVFVQLFYHSDLSWVNLTMHAVVFFVSIFVTLHLATVLFKTYGGKYIMGGTPNPKKTATMIAYVLGLLCLVELFCNLLPIHLALYYLLPLILALILWKSEKYMSVKENRDFLFMVFGACSVILPAVAIQELFYLIFLN